MLLETDHAETRRLVSHYVARLGLPTDQLWLTTSRKRFAEWLGRPVRSSLGGAYAFLPRSGTHIVLINLARIDLSQSRALEVVVAEELVHMRDRLDGDLRRHAKHGHDRIAHRVAGLTGASLEEIRAALLPTTKRRLRYVYACPGCGRQVPRRSRGIWSCGVCASRFDPRFTLQLVEDRGPARPPR